MAKRKVTIGAGITAHERTQYSGEDLALGFDIFLRGWRKAFSEGGGNFGAEVLEQERSCRRILAAAGDGPFAADSLQDYARRIVSGIDRTKKRIRSGDADEAAREAVHVGRLVTEVHMKHRWEEHALRGARNYSILKAASSQANRKKQSAATSRQMEWQAMANKLWAQNKYLSKSAVAGRIANKVGGNPNTIRRKITAE